LKYFIYGDEYAGNLYLSKYSKYNEELPKDMWQLYIHHSLPCSQQYTEFGPEGLPMFNLVLPQPMVMTNVLQIN
jgi:hypothetical protein